MPAYADFAVKLVMVVSEALSWIGQALRGFKFVNQTEMRTGKY